MNRDNHNYGDFKVDSIHIDLDDLATFNNEQDSLIDAHFRRIANAFNEISGLSLTGADIELIKQLDVSILKHHGKKNKNILNQGVPQAILDASK